MKKSLVFLLVLISLLPATGQTKVMRTRLLTSLSNVEIEQYLKRNDVIFVPIGTVEVHGGLPVDCEYVGALAVAIKMAEKADGLVLPYVAFGYPGATTVGRGTIYFRSSDFLDYLKIIARSLLRQGFKTQIYVTAHGPSYLYTAPLVREFLDETKVPILAIDLATVMANYGGDSFGQFDNFMFGAYSIVGRLEDIPLDFSGFDLPAEIPVIPEPQQMERNKLNSHTAIGFYYPTPFAHGGIPKSITASQREQYAEEGTKYINNLVEAMDMNAIVNSLKSQQKWIIDELLPRYGDLLPEQNFTPTQQIH